MDEIASNTYLNGLTIMVWQKNQDAATCLLAMCGCLRIPLKGVEICKAGLAVPRTILNRQKTILLKMD